MRVPCIALGMLIWWGARLVGSDRNASWTKSRIFVALLPHSHGHGLFVYTLVNESHSNENVRFWQNPHHRNNYDFLCIRMIILFSFLIRLNSYL